MTQEDVRHDWRVAEVMDLLDTPFNDLLYRAQSVHRRHHEPNEIQVSTLFSIKTGGCPEDCRFCPQSVHYNTGLDPHGLLGVDAVVGAARQAQAAGATRFCMGAGWRGPTKSQVRRVCTLIEGVADLGMETCATLGMLTREKAADLARAGLDYYNHNLDTSPEYYGEVITTRTYQDRLETLANVRAAGMRVCCGGIVGMGESRRDRAGLLAQLANLPRHPESVPINNLVRTAGTPMQDVEALAPLEMARCVAVARILMPYAVLRLGAGRANLSETDQALCLLAGGGSIFGGGLALTMPNPGFGTDREMFSAMGLVPRHARSACCARGRHGN